MKTDKQLKNDVIAELNWEPSINAEKIAVQVNDGVVTLIGPVASYADKYNAEHAAQRVSGVQALTVELNVELPGMHKRDDVDIARSIEGVFEWTSLLPKDAVKVMVEDGWITLSGEVDWEYQRQVAVDAVRYLMGVTGVSDDITIKSKVSPKLVKADIEAALNRRAQDDARNITVAIHDADVTLTGKVHSWTERELATHSAWCTPGVRKVTDHMTIAY